LSENKGFTLIEMMIVLVIIGIMAATAYPSLSGTVKMSNENDRAKHEYVVNKALKQYYALTGIYPKGVDNSDPDNPKPIELSTLASDLAQQTGVRMNTTKYKYTPVLNGTEGVKAFDVELLIKDSLW